MWIRTEVIEATEFRQWAVRYQAYAVPRLVINGQHFVDGALPEPILIRHLLSALGLDEAPGRGATSAAPRTKVEPPSL
jgi:hypothetical protein